MLSVSRFEISYKVYLLQTRVVGYTVFLLLVYLFHPCVNSLPFEFFIIFGKPLDWLK